MIVHIFFFFLRKSKLIQFSILLKIFSVLYFNVIIVKYLYLKINVLKQQILNSISNGHSIINQIIHQKL